MDNRTINSRLAKRLNMNTKETSSITEQLVSVIKDSLSDLDKVAIPGFGTFDPVKEDEYIDIIDGHKVLMPPSISVKFNPGTQLKKNTRRI